ncbi:structural protein [Cellulophaga phage phi4:1]|uniref:Structural protein n=5 Tax=Lightbulbvirus TaxID=1918522 RepID=A0A0S2MWF6_9CAUD|nr:virion structural protein [Cellulophaga phage phi4:1]YP_008241541.1 virion structural protein [Cellulophaga phage phi17:2]ALO80054.1 structural protein [Cellulophaga phage phi4:1_13]ALO80251.1 structural protein [Cellulophaga phage phi4:1_18]ALO80449.1 structural protein [Cellulophaga phage phi17:2_18]AGO47579.1 structural protein [Cellulophaga phage phi17:2]AGO49458.1 structural protein [Cellulophaga phage phi4:1]
MNTYKKVVDRIARSLKSVNKDDRIPKRQILSVFQSHLEFLIAQKLNDRSLYREEGVYTLIECLEMEKVDTYSCDIIEFRSCNKVMRSKKKLPKIINSRFGPGVRNVTNIDYSIEYYPTTPAKYRNSKLREEQVETKNYYIKNGHPTLPESTTQLINLEVITLETYLLSGVSSCAEDTCKSYWEYEVPTSDKLTLIAIQETLKELLTGRQLPEDENPNMNSNEKSKTTP